MRKTFPTCYYSLKFNVLSVSKSSCSIQNGTDQPSITSDFIPCLYGWGPWPVLNAGILKYPYTGTPYWGHWSVSSKRLWSWRKSSFYRLDSHRCTCKITRNASALDYVIEWREEMNKWIETLSGKKTISQLIWRGVANKFPLKINLRRTPYGIPAYGYTPLYRGLYELFVLIPGKRTNSSRWTIQIKRTWNLTTAIQQTTAIKHLQAVVINTDLNTP